MKNLKVKSILLAFTTLFAIAFLISSCEQESVINNDITEINTGDNMQNRYVFEGLKPFEGVAALTERERQDATYFERNEEALKTVLNRQPAFMTLNIPLSSKVVELELDKWDILSDDFVIEDENGQILPHETSGIFYNGTVKGESNTAVAVSIFENQLNVTIMSPEETRVVKQEDDLMAYYKVVDKANFNMPQLNCNHTDTDLSEIKVEVKPENTIIQRAGCTYDPIRVRYLIDYSFKKFFNNSNWQARNYLYARFNEVKSMYAYWNIPVEIGKVDYLPYHKRLKNNPNTNTNATGEMYADFRSRYGWDSSDDWDVNAALVAVDAIGGTSGSIVGGGHAVVSESSSCGNSAPICKTGIDLDAPNWCRPNHLIGLHETSPNNPDDDYFTYTLAHELGHNFGISQEYNGVTNDVMDHGSNHALFIAHTTYVDMYSAWVSCYYNCN